MAITKAMLARCQNEKMQAFCALDVDVQEAISGNFTYAEKLVRVPIAWELKICWMHNEIVRLSPDTPTEPEWDDRDVASVGGYYSYSPSGLIDPCYWSFARHANLMIADCPTMPRFLGIIYRDATGTETLRTSVDAAFGTPVRVRFAK